MDNQMKPDLLDICVLAAIRDEDSYSYKIIKDMKSQNGLGSLRRCSLLLPGLSYLRRQCSCVAGISLR